MIATELREALADLAALVEETPASGLVSVRAEVLDALLALLGKRSANREVSELRVSTREPTRLASR